MTRRTLFQWGLGLFAAVLVKPLSVLARDAAPQAPLSSLGAVGLTSYSTPFVNYGTAAQAQSDDCQLVDEYAEDNEITMDNEITF